MRCLSVFLFGLNFFGILWASWTCMSISFTGLGKFSFIIFSNKFSIFCSSSSSSGTPMIQMLECLKLSQRVNSLFSFLELLFLYSVPLECLFLPFVPNHFSHCHNPHRFLQPDALKLSFPMLEPWVAQSVLLPSCSSQFICMLMWGHLVFQPLPCHMSFPPQLLISTPPTSLDECFFFNFLVVGLPYSSIFWQFWLFFIFKLVAILLLVVWGSKAYLPAPPSWPEVASGIFVLPFHPFHFILFLSRDEKIFFFFCLRHISLFLCIR